MTDSDTVFFDFLSMCYFRLGFVYAVEQEAYWVGLHCCKSFSVLMVVEVDSPGRQCSGPNALSNQVDKTYLL